MNKNILKGLYIAFTVFVLMFIFRLIYGYLVKETTREFNVQNFESSQGLDSLYIKQNIATQKIKYEGKGVSVRSVDQKYEKVANIESRSTDIENDEKKVRNLINSSGSVIQNEDNSGIKNMRNRVIKIAAGVPPEKFDDMIEEFKKIGKTISLTINKKDKTNEYKDLQAKKESLLKIRGSLMNLKNKGGKIDEYINLENRILEIEKEIQKLGLSLGEFDSENEFCTILLVMYESKSTGEISFIHRVKVSLEWTIKYHLLLSLSFLFILWGLHLGLPLYEKYSTAFITRKRKRK